MRRTTSNHALMVGAVKPGTQQRYTHHLRTHLPLFVHTFSVRNGIACTLPPAVRGKIHGAPGHLDGTAQELVKHTVCGGYYVEMFKSREDRQKDGQACVTTHSTRKRDTAAQKNTPHEANQHLQQSQSGEGRVRGRQR